MKIGKQSRSLVASVEDVAIKDDSNTIEFPFSSEEPVERWFGDEVLSHEPGAMDLARVQSGAAPFLWNHDTNQPIGVIESGEVRGKRGYARATFFSTPFAQEKKQQMKEGLRNVSFAYQIKEAKQTRQESDNKPAEILATKYSVYEISLVSVPADFKQVGVGRAEGEDGIEVSLSNETISPEITITETPKMNEQEQKALEAKFRAEAIESERARATAINAMGEKFKKAELARSLVNGGKSIDEAREAFLNEISSAQKPVTGNEGNIGLTEKETRNYSFMRVLNALANPGNRKMRELAAFEFEASEAAAKLRGKEARGILVPFDVLAYGQRDLSKGTASAGGYLVGTQHMAGSFIEMLRNKSILDRAGATILNGLVQDVAIPKQTGASTAYWVAEGSAPTESAQTFGQVAMSPKTVGAFVDLSRKLLIQSSPDIENLVKNDLAKVLALAIDLAGLYGSGSSNQPQGIAGGSFVSGLNTLDLASATEMTHAEAILMETAIAADNADVENMKYLASAVQRGGMKAKVKFSSTDSLTVWSENNKINGYDALCSTQVSSADVFFGNWADLVIGFWSGLDLNMDPAALATSGGMRLIALQDCDVAVRHGESFCYANSSIA